MEELRELGSGFEEALEYASTCCEEIQTTDSSTATEAIVSLIGEFRRPVGS